MRRSSHALARPVIPRPPTPDRQTMTAMVAATVATSPTTGVDARRPTQPDSLPPRSRLGRAASSMAAVRADRHRRASSLPTGRASTPPRPRVRSRCASDSESANERRRPPQASPEDPPSPRHTEAIAGKPRSDDRAGAVGVGSVDDGGAAAAPERPSPPPHSAMAVNDTRPAETRRNLGEGGP